MRCKSGKTGDGFIETKCFLFEHIARLSLSIRCLIVALTPRVDTNQDGEFIIYAKVQFILSGDKDQTDVLTLEDDQRKILRRGATDSFLMTCPR